MRKRSNREHPSKNHPTDASTVTPEGCSATSQPEGCHGLDQRIDATDSAEPLAGQLSVAPVTTKAADESLPCHPLREELAELKAEVKEIHAAVRELLVGQHTDRAQYSVAEVAQLLNKKPYTVREWCRLRRINAVSTHSGRGVYCEWRISKEEVQRIRDEGLLPDPRK